MTKDIVVYNEDIAQSCVYGPELVKDLLCIDGHSNIYTPEQYVSMSNKKLEGLKRIALYRSYYQRNPVFFIRDFFNIQLLDSQAYLLMEAWGKRQTMLLASRAYGKSFWVVLFCMTKQMLASTPWICYIASGSAEQSATTFKKLEDIANDRVDSLLNSTGSIFKNEVEINNATGDGFSHNPAGFEYHLYNSSMTKSLNSNVDRNRGKRSSCVIYDECSFLSPELISVYQAFCSLDKDFKTGVMEDGSSFDNVYLHSLPKEIPNQLIYVSSASSTDTEFYRMYREFSKKMLIGDPNYFVADIDCELVMMPTIGGNRVKSVLTRELIESSLSTNPIKTRREFFNEFSEDAGADAIIRRGVITRNEQTRRPILSNETGDKKYIITYDPARMRDNSIILVGELYNAALKDQPVDLKVKLVNCISLVDIGKRNKTPMQTPDQVDYLRKIILDYNGGADSYGNIVGIWIDSGAGGAGPAIADLLMQDWETKDGIIHRGLIDREYSSDYVKKFPDAIDKVHMMSPSTFKSLMYEQLIEMLNQDKISFTATYDNKGTLTIFDIDEELLREERNRIEDSLKKKKISKDEFDAMVQDELGKIQAVNTKVVKLDWEEELALVNIDCLKEELVNVVRKKREGAKDSFDLSPEKANKMHDDRAYTACMMGWALAQERRKLILNKKPKQDPKSLAQQLIIRRGSYAGKII